MRITESEADEAKDGVDAFRSSSACTATMTAEMS